MKKTFKFLGIAFIAMAIIFSMTACDDSGGGGGGGLGEEISLTVPSVQGVNASTSINFPYINFANGGTPSLLSEFSPGSEVKIVNGTLTITLKAVANDKLFSISEVLPPGNSVVTSPELKTYFAGGFTDKVIDDYRLMCGTGENYEFALLGYSNKDELVTGSFTDEGVTFNLNFNLKKGWNYMVQKVVSENNISQYTGNPPSNYKWIVWDMRD